MDTDVVVRRHVYVSGRVQRVFFRDSCRRQAQRLGVTGWVRNLPDGRVEAVFEGSPDAVDEMVAWSHDGPAGARVHDVEALDEQPQGLPAFEVR